MRKKRSEDEGKKLKRKSKWRQLFGQCWWKKRRRQRSYQDYWSSSREKSKKSHFFCYCCRRRTNGYGYDSEEEDDDIDAKVASYIVEMKQREAAANGQKEAKVAAEELSRSPVIGQRQADGSGSPIQSRASSETWPTQSDEDIDRLVAMHQNRSSLSSLGVRSESMASVYSGAGEGRYGTVVVKGQVEFAMQYNYKLSALEVHVVRCKDLAAVDAKRNRSDPYVKVYLLPDKSKAGKRKTKVKKHTLNPIFDETMRFHTPISSLESRTLWLTVWHSDMFGRNDFLGEVSVNLQGRLFDNPQSQWYLLQERSEPFDEVATYRGDIVVGLKYIPPENIKSSFFSRGSSITGSSSNLRKFGGSIKSVASKSERTSKGGQLHVLVKEAKHLSPIKANGTCDAFCKSYLLPDRTRSSKQKTPVVKRTLHPSWNYTFVYEDVSLEELSERALELTVWDHDRLASNEFVGGIRFSLGTGRSYGRQVEWMDATGKELSLWQNMLDRPNFWVEGSLVLRSSLDGIRANLP
nr:IP13955p [Drosophila melanogaster]